MGFRRKIDDIEVVANEDEVWFLQGDKMCWTTTDEVWSASSRVSRMLQEKGFKVHAQRFPRKLREMFLLMSRLRK